MRLDVRTVLVLRDPDGRRALLLRRSPDKRLFPGLITGLGGAVELAAGEGEDLDAALQREVAEEAPHLSDLIADLRLRLTTVLTRGTEQVLLLWYTARLTAAPTPDQLRCSEGTLEPFANDQLPLDQMVPTARAAIPFILSLPEGDPTAYNGTFVGPELTLIVNR